MNFSAPFIVRPTATTLLVIGLILLGLVAYFLLPIAGVPQVDIPTVQISARLPGANAETMATSVAAPLERQLSLISGVTSMSSASSLGQTSIQVEFDLSRSLDGATQDVQAAINAAGGQLPKNLPNPPTYEKINPADALLMSIAIMSPDLPIAKVDDYVENYLAPQISRITGVGMVDFHGQQKPAVRVQVDPSVASAMGLSLEDVRAAIGTATVNAPKGTLDGRRQSLTLDTTDQIFDASAFNSVIVAYRNGAPVRISDLGKAVNGVEDVREAAWLNGERAIIIDVHKQPGYNVNQTVQLVKDALPGLKRTLPPSIVVRVLGDRTQTIRASISDVQFTMAISIGLVVLVMFLFLRNSRNADSERHHPGFPAGDLRGDVPGRLHHRQRIVDGAHHRGRLHHRRRGGDGGEYHSPYRSGRAPAAGRPARIAGDRLHYCIHDLFVDSGVSAVAVDGRADRTTVPRIRRHRECGDRHLGNCRPDADADDVRLAAAGG